MPRLTAQPNDLITAELLQAATDDTPKRFADVAERHAAYSRPVTDLARPDANSRPPKKGETSVITGGTWGGIQVYNGTGWKPLRSESVTAATAQINDSAVLPADLPADLNFTVVLLNAGTDKIVVHYIVEEYPIIDGDRSPTLTAGTHFTASAGSVLYDPDNPDEDDFTDSVTGYTATISVPVTAAAATQLTGRFLVRLFDPYNVRLVPSLSSGVGLIRSGTKPFVKLYDTAVETEHDPDVKEGDPVTTQATSARFPLRVFVPTPGATNNFPNNNPVPAQVSTAASTFGSGVFAATADEDYTAVSNRTINLQDYKILNGTVDVAIPEQLAETDERFDLILTPSGTSAADFLRKRATCTIEGNPASPIVVIDPTINVTSDGNDNIIPVPWHVFPAASFPITIEYDFNTAIASSYFLPGIDVPDYTTSNPGRFVIPAGRHSGVLRIPTGWFSRWASSGEPERSISFPVAFRVVGNIVPITSSSSSPYFHLRYARNVNVVRLPQLTADHSARSEQAGILSFTLALDRAAAHGKTATVDWTTIGLTASPADYGIPTVPPTGVTYATRPNGELYGKVSFPSAEGAEVTRRRIDLAVTKDTLIEEDERLRVRLSAPYGCQLVRREVTGVIRNDDLTIYQTGIPDFSLRDGTLVGNTMVFVAELSRPAGSAVTFDVTTMDGTATAAADYLPITGRRVVIGAGRTSAQIVVSLRSPVGDTNAEVFLLQASNLSGNAVPVRLGARGVIPATG